MFWLCSKPIDFVFLCFFDSVLKLDEADGTPIAVVID